MEGRKGRTDGGNKEQGREKGKEEGKKEGREEGRKDGYFGTLSEAQ